MARDQSTRNEDATDPVGRLEKHYKDTMCYEQFFTCSQQTHTSGKWQYFMTSHGAFPYIIHADTDVNLMLLITVYYSKCITVYACNFVQIFCCLLCYKKYKYTFPLNYFIYQYPFIFLFSFILFEFQNLFLLLV